MMKVIHIPRRFVEHEWGGTETCILQLSKHMNQAGHEAKIMTSMALADVHQETIQGVPISRFSYCYPFFGLSSEDVKNMDKKGGNLLSFSLFWALLREPNVDLIHAHTGKRVGAIARMVAKLRGIPYVITLHGGVFDVPKREMEQMLKPISNTFEWGKLFGALLGSRRVLEDASAVFCVGENEYRAAKAALPQQHVELTPNGVSNSFFADGHGDRFRREHRIASDKKVILCLSRIDYQKNQIAAVEALPQIKVGQPKAHLVLVGPITVASYYVSLLQCIKDLGLEEDVSILPGIKPGEQALADAYHAADVFCLPSLHEPFGIVILEAWAAGCPVAAADVGGIPFFTEEGRDILRFNPENKADIAAAITRLLTDTDLAGRLVKAGQCKVQERYDWRAITEDMLGIYQKLL